MDLIGQLAGALNVDSSKAEDAAGGVLGVLQRHAPEGALDGLFAKAPEAKGWIAKAGPLLAQASGGEGGEAGGLLGGVGAMLGGGAGGILQGSAVVQSVLKVVEGLGVPPELAAKALPLVLRFIQERLGGEGFQALTEKLPVLDQLSAATGEEAASDGGGLGGLLGGLLK